MQSLRNISNENLANTPRSSAKRRLSEKQKESPILKNTSKPFTSGNSTLFLKRVKTTHSSKYLGRSENMSKTLRIGARPQVIDLTRPSNFQPSTGAKRLTIKNLRTTSRLDVENFYKRTLAELDNALTAVFTRNQPSSPLEVLCRGVEAVCRHGGSQELFKNLRNRCRIYLEDTLLSQIEVESGTNNVDTLRAVHKFWTIWNEQFVSPFHDLPC